MSLNDALLEIVIKDKNQSGAGISKEKNSAQVESIEGIDTDRVRI